MKITQLELEIKVVNTLRAQRLELLKELHRLDMLIHARESQDKMILRLVDYLRTSPKYRSKGEKIDSAEYLVDKNAR